MTNALNSPLPDLPGGTLPRRSPGRETRIAAIHAAANWFAEHHGEQAPTHVNLNCHISFLDEPDAGLRVAAVQQFADRNGVKVQTSDTTMWADLTLISEGILVTYSVLTTMVNSERFA